MTNAYGAATAALSQEHRSIDRVTTAMSEVADNIEQGRDVDASIFEDMILFLHMFAEECQHAKEEASLFPALEAKCPCGSPSACLLTDFRSEHEDAKLMAAELRAVSDAYNTDKDIAGGSLIRVLRNLTTLYKQHLWKEDHILLPMAEDLLSDAEKETLRKAFESYRPRLSTEELAGRIERRLTRCRCHLGQVLI